MNNNSYESKNPMKSKNTTAPPVFKFSLSGNYVGIGLTTAFFLFLAAYGIGYGEVGAGVLTLAFVGLGFHLLYKS